MSAKKKNIGQKSLEEGIQAIREHRAIESDVRLASLKYRAALHKASLVGDKESILEVLEKKDLEDLLRKRRPPIQPSVSFFSFPWPDPDPGRPDPDGWIPRFDRDRLIRVERMLRLQSLAQICESTQNLSLDPTDYIEAELAGSASGSQSGPKSIYMLAAAGTSRPDSSLALLGFRSSFTATAGENPMLEITSRLNSAFGWVEANTMGAVNIVIGIVPASSGARYAKVSARAFLTVFANGEVIRPNPATMVNSGTLTQDQIYLEEWQEVGTEITARINLPTGGPYEIVIEELVELVAEASPDGHAYIEGGFTWDPLAVVIREGCNLVRWESMTPFPYW